MSAVRRQRNLVARVGGLVRRSVVTEIVAAVIGQPGVQQEMRGVEYLLRPIVLDMTRR